MDGCVNCGVEIGRCGGGTSDPCVGDTEGGNGRCLGRDVGEEADPRASKESDAGCGCVELDSVEKKEGVAPVGCCKEGFSCCSVWRVEAVVADDSVLLG